MHISRCSSYYIWVTILLFCMKNIFCGKLKLFFIIVLKLLAICALFYICIFLKECSLFVCHISRTLCSDWNLKHYIDEFCCFIYNIVSGTANE